MRGMIRKLASGQYRLYSRKVDPRTGKKRNLGTFASRAAAEKHERGRPVLQASLASARRAGAPVIEAHAAVAASVLAHPVSATPAAIRAPASSNRGVVCIARAYVPFREWRTLAHLGPRP